jgi:hypothetical protein
VADDVDVDVELLVVPDCPNAEAAARLLHDALVDLGLTDTNVRTTVIATQSEAECRGFAGSPTFLVDGIDPFAEPGRRPGLTCRVYHRADGMGGVPGLTELREALKRAADRARPG